VKPIRTHRQLGANRLAPRARGADDARTVRHDSAHPETFADLSAATRRKTQQHVVKLGAGDGKRPRAPVSIVGQHVLHTARRAKAHAAQRTTPAQPTDYAGA
jgi:hypothetical protein